MIAAVKLRHGQNAVSQFPGQGIRLDAPLPVPDTYSRAVHAGFISLDQEILDRNDGKIRHRAECLADEVPGKLAVIRVQRIDIAADKIPVMITDVINPAARCHIVMSARVHDAVRNMVVGQV